MSIADNAVFSLLAMICFLSASSMYLLIIQKDKAATITRTTYTPVEAFGIRGEALIMNNETWKVIGIIKDGKKYYWGGMKKYIILLLVLSGCSNANRAAISAWGKPHEVKCYSGGVLIYEGSTTGKIENEEHSDGYYFQDSKTKNFITVSGNCVITVEAL